MLKRHEPVLFGRHELEWDAEGEQRQFVDDSARAESPFTDLVIDTSLPAVSMTTTISSDPSGWTRIEPGGSSGFDSITSHIPGGRAARMTSNAPSPGTSSPTKDRAPPEAFCHPAASSEADERLISHERRVVCERVWKARIALVHRQPAGGREIERAPLLVDGLEVDVVRRGEGIHLLERRRAGGNRLLKGGLNFGGFEAGARVEAGCRRGRRSPGPASLDATVNALADDP